LISSATVIQRREGFILLDRLAVAEPGPSLVLVQNLRVPQELLELEKLPLHCRVHEYIRRRRWVTFAVVLDS
jgi:hypothetical protein